MYKNKYFVNKDKRTVVCVISCDEFAALDFVEKDKRVLLTNYDGLKDCLMPTRFVGVAKCSELDEFDEQYGRDLAFYRAKAKYDIAFTRRVTNVIRHYNRWLDTALDRAYRYHKKSEFNRIRKKAELFE